MLAGGAAVLAQLPALGATTARAAPSGAMTLAWHAGFASRWLDPQEHDGTATPDNFFTALHDALIKNSGHARSTTIPPSPSGSRSPRTRRAPRSRCARASSSTTAIRSPRRTSSSATRTTGAPRPTSSRRRPSASRSSTTARSASSSRSPSSTSPSCSGPANVAGPGWVVPEKYYKQVGPDAFKQKPIGAGPYKLVRHEPGVKVEMEAFDGYYRPVNVKQLVMIVGAGGGHPGRHAGARRGGHRLQRPRRADRPRSGSFPGSRWRRCCPARSSSSSPASRTRRTRSATSACARR